ncbi:MAG TPA: xanthine dehydrogenase family protein molybdopterin-binding subunit [Methylomirabilota bacterium]|nr:xanthine dehydrogenase family protein molybdopterin-binding subunit [Methylomirabilota bacterium]
MKFIGDRLLRKEDPRLVQGRGRYVGDIRLPGMLEAAIVRSPHAHARIVAIDRERALKAPGVVGVLTFADLGEAARPLPIVPPHAALRGKNFQLLAERRACFVGEAVAVVLAESRQAAADARALIDVSWEPLPAVQDPTAPGEARVHDDIPDNLAGRVTLSRGDVAAALAAAPRRAQLRLAIGRAGGQPMETRGLVAEYNAMADLLTVWASSQVPHQVRQFVCEVLGLEPHRVRVIAPDVGGGFGAKLIVYPEDVLIPLLALRCGRPVRWLEDRLEHMQTATQERRQTHTVDVGFDDEGRLLALRDRFVHDTGAYTPRGLVVPLLTASMLAGPYRVPSVEVTFDSVYTHRVPVTPYRGAGQPQAVFVIERVMDLIARKTGRDRAAVRFTNLVQPTDMPYDVGLANYRGSGNVVYDSGDYPAVLRRALETSGWDQLAKDCARARHEGRRLGLGLACYVELTGVGPFEGATIRADAAGRITVFTGVPSQGQGLETTLAQVAADELGVTPAEVSVTGGDTLGIPQGIGTFASRAAVVGGNAVALAARELRRKCVRLAALALGIAEDDVQQHGKRFAERANPDRFVELGRLAAAAAVAPSASGVPPGLEATHYFQPPDIAYSSGACVALAEVDPETGRVRIAGYWMSHDSGRLINPTVVEGQLHGAIAIGLGSALLEEIRYDANGQPLAGSFMDYALPRSDDLPSLQIDHLETPSPLNPLGLKGVGESGTLPVPAVVASAVEDALGVRIDDMPIAAARLREAWLDRGSAAARTPRVL